MVMTAEEIKTKFDRHGGRTKRTQRAYIKVLAELNDCSVDDIKHSLDDVLGKEKPKVKNVTPKEEKPHTDHDKDSIDYIKLQLINEAIISYVCSLREDNERLDRLLIREGKRGRCIAGIQRQIDINEQKIALLKGYQK